MKRRLLFLFLLIFSIPAFAQGTHRQSEVLTIGQGTAANLVPFAKIKVCVAGTLCQQQVTVYSDIALTQVLQQPLTADAVGNYDYYIAPGCYDEQYTAPAIKLSLRKNVCTGPTTATAPGGNTCNQQYKGSDGTLKGDTGSCTDGAGNVSVSTLLLAADPVQPLQSATKQYVDNHTGSPSAGTPVQKGNGSGGFSNATIADLNLYTPKYANTQGSTYAALYAAGNQVTTGGPTGPTDTPCAPFNQGGSAAGHSFNYIYGTQTDCYMGAAAAGHIQNVTARYFSNAADLTGQGRIIGTVDYFYDSTLGRSYSGIWHNATNHNEIFQSSAAGIKQLRSGGCFITGVGDNSCSQYKYNNVISGTADTGSDEGTEDDIIQHVSLGSYFSTANSAYPQSTTEIYTNAITGCGQNAVSFRCAGAGRPLLKVSSAQSVTVTGATASPTFTGWLQLTTTENLTPSISGWGVVAAASPTAVTNLYTGDAFSSTVSVSSGSFPASGIGCWAGQSGTLQNFTHEEVSYTYSGGTLSISDRRTYHPANSVFFAGPCRWFAPTLDTALNGSSSAWLAIITDANTIIVTTQFTGQANATWLTANGYSAFMPSSGVTARQMGKVYQGADVVSVSDPSLSTAPSNYVVGGQDNNGFFKLSAHEFSIASGDIFEQAILPVDVTKVRTTTCGNLQPSSGSNPSTCQGTLVTNYTNSVYSTGIALPYSRFNTSPSTPGYVNPPNIFDFFVYGSSAPYNNLFHFGNGAAPVKAVFQWDTVGPTSKVWLMNPNGHSLWYDPTMTPGLLPEWGADGGFQTPSGRVYTMGVQIPLGNNLSYGWSNCGSLTIFCTTQTAGLNSTSAGNVTCDTTTSGNALCNFKAGTVSVAANPTTALQVTPKQYVDALSRLVPANNLSDLTSASTARTNLGLGTMATQNANSVAITGGTAALTSGTVGGSNICTAANGLCSSTAVTFQTNGSTNPSQTVLNHQNGTNTTVTNPSSGNVQVNVTSLNNAPVGNTTPSTGVFTTASASVYKLSGAGTLSTTTGVSGGTVGSFGTQNGGTVSATVGSSTTITAGTVLVSVTYATPYSTGSSVTITPTDIGTSTQGTYYVAATNSGFSILAAQSQTSAAWNFNFTAAGW
ncbi:hypothetical protein [Terriglobus roseus]|uniref:Right handed beta helix region n=1 Tax=Terriglobus roseus TaxID=392734 RepID=A0A1G7GDU2_9BACT|nr:hypothetical protein [Terriglobus roseus]SDE86255.1 hypothetical protein SAMN05444167_0659 [Terriglobus roseus]